MPTRSSRLWQHDPEKWHSNKKYKKDSEVTFTSKHEATGEWLAYYDTSEAATAASSTHCEV